MYLKYQECAHVVFDGSYLTSHVEEIEGMQIYLTSHVEESGGLTLPLLYFTQILNDLLNRESGKICKDISALMCSCPFLQHAN